MSNSKAQKFAGIFDIRFMAYCEEIIKRPMTVTAEMHGLGVFATMYRGRHPGEYPDDDSAYSQLTPLYEDYSRLPPATDSTDTGDGAFKVYGCQAFQHTWITDRPDVWIFAHYDKAAQKLVMFGIEDVNFGQSEGTNEANSQMLSTWDYVLPPTAKEIDGGRVFDNALKGGNGRPKMSLRKLNRSIVSTLWEHEDTKIYNTLDWEDLAKPADNDWTTGIHKFCQITKVRCSE